MAVASAAAQSATQQATVTPVAELADWLSEAPMVLRLQAFGTVLTFPVAPLTEGQGANQTSVSQMVRVSRGHCRGIAATT